MRAAGSVGRAEALRHDAFQAELAGLAHQPRYLHKPCDLERVARGPIFAAFAALNYSGIVLVNGGAHDA